MRGRPWVPASSILTVRPLTFGTSRGLTRVGSVWLPYGGSFSKGAIVVICAGAAADAIATPPSAEAPARNSRLESPGVAVPFMVPPCASSRRERYESGGITLARNFRARDPRSCRDSRRDAVRIETVIGRRRRSGGHSRQRRRRAHYRPG